MPETPHTQAADAGAEIRASLVPHPSSVGAAVEAISATVRFDQSRLRIRYSVRCESDRLALPEQKTPIRKDNLWRHTCFEAFVSDGKGYREFNFSPSSEWAAYYFGGYRTGMTPLNVEPPIIRAVAAPLQFDLYADVRLDDELLTSAQPWRLGLSAIIETVAREKSYWALAHPDGDPDFHHASCFALQIPGACGP